MPRLWMHRGTSFVRAILRGWPAGADATRGRPLLRLAGGDLNKPGGIYWDIYMPRVIGHCFAAAGRDLNKPGEVGDVFNPTKWVRPMNYAGPDPTGEDAAGAVRICPACNLDLHPNPHLPTTYESPEWSRSCLH